MTGELYETGDVLLTLSRENEQILTYWGKLEPVIIENQESGKVYFTKVDINYGIKSGLFIVFLGTILGTVTTKVIENYDNLHKLQQFKVSI